MIDQFIENVEPDLCIFNIIESLFKYKFIKNLVANELPDSSPRFVLYKYDLNRDPAYQQPTLAFIHFNPWDTEVPIKRMYSESKKEILRQIKGYKEFEINDIREVNLEWFHHKVTNFLSSIVHFHSQQVFFFLKGNWINWKSV